MSVYRTRGLPFVAAAALLYLSPAVVVGSATPSTPSPGFEKRWTIADLKASDATPHAIAHRGMGATDGSGANLMGLPTENTIESIEAAFEAGARIVEVDVQLTADGEALVYHNDFLSDFTCISHLDRKALKTALPKAPTLKELLKKVKKYSKQDKEDVEDGDMPSGLVIIEVKPLAPICDPGDTLEVTLIDAVVHAIYNSSLSEQVIINSFSPSLLQIAGNVAPEIERGLEASFLQFLPPEVVGAELGMDVVFIDKDVGLGLQWAETGQLFRLPGYSPRDQYMATAVTLGVSFVSLDKVLINFLGMDVVKKTIELFQQLGLHVLIYTAASIEEWTSFAPLGVDGIYTDAVVDSIAAQMS